MSDIKKIEQFLQQSVITLKKKYQAEHLGIGYKFTNGKRTDKIAIIFFVNKKVSKAHLVKKGINSIPKEIEGIGTDVVEMSQDFEIR